MSDSVQQTLFALDCGATNWRLYRVEYRVSNQSARIINEPQPASLTSFIDRKLPAAICLNPEGTDLDSFGDIAQQQQEDEQNRDRVREYFKPCIGSHLEKNPLPHQIRYTHAQALLYTKMLLTALIKQLRQEKWRSQDFDERVFFTFAYPVHWKLDHEGKIFEDFKLSVLSCFGESFSQIRFVPEPEGAILSLQRRGLLECQGNNNSTIIVDVGGSTTDIVAGEVDPLGGRLNFIGRYGEPFGGGLYDFELAKFIADNMNIPASALADDPSALVTLRVFGQRLKESLSRQLLNPNKITLPAQRMMTLVMRDGTPYRRNVVLDEEKFKNLTQRLHVSFENLISHALSKISLREQDIGQVVLVGGGSQLFTIVEYLRNRFGNQKVILADNSDEIVAQGIGLEYEASFNKPEQTSSLSIDYLNSKPVENTSISGPNGGWKLECVGKPIFVVSGKITRIGRGETNDIWMDDIKASRFHAEILLKDGQLEIVDKGSTNGTFINGDRLTPNQPQTLLSNDEIMIGKTIFICKQ